MTVSQTSTTRPSPSVTTAGRRLIHQWGARVTGRDAASKTVGAARSVRSVQHHQPSLMNRHHLHPRHRATLGQAGLDGRGRIGRESRPHICSLVCTRAYGTCTHAETSVARRAHVSGSRRIWTSGLCMCPVRTVFVIRCERHACRTFVWSTVASCSQGILQEFAGPFRGFKKSFWVQPLPDFLRFLRLPGPGRHRIFLKCVCRFS